MRVPPRKGLSWFRLLWGIAWTLFSAVRFVLGAASFAMLGRVRHRGWGSWEPATVAMIAVHRLTSCAAWWYVRKGPTPVGQPL